VRHPAFAAGLVDQVVGFSSASSLRSRFSSRKAARASETVTFFLLSQASGFGESLT